MKKNYKIQPTTKIGIALVQHFLLSEINMIPLFSVNNIDSISCIITSPQMLDLCWCHIVNLSLSL